MWLNKHRNSKKIGYKFLDEIFRDIINQPKNVEGWIKLMKIN
jgi:hypothetical protein